MGAAAPEEAQRLWRAYTEALTVPSASGRFGADMQIEAHLDGPVTLALERATGSG